MAVPGRSAARRTGQVLTGFGALVVLIAVLVGGPVALLAFAGNPLPDHVPTLAEIGATLTSRDDGQLFLRVLALVGWFGWATFAFSVLVELGAQSLRRPAPRLPGISRQQRAAAALVGSVALIIAASPAAASAATVLAGPYPTVAQPAVAAAAPVARPVSATLPAHARTASPVVVTTAAQLPEPVEPVVYRVAKGDYLGEVAERYLDDFDRYRDVARLNRLHDPDRIRPGQLIRLPDGAGDAGTRTHATGRLVARPTTPAPGGAVTPPPAAPATPPAAEAPATPATTPPATPRATRPAPAPSTTQPSAESTRDTQQVGQPPSGSQPAMAAGASRASEEDQLNRPLAVSAVLAVASIVGAQIGAVLGLRRRPSVARAAAGARSLVSGRHRRN
ncbi:LysM peptidoglycan-binding domain-containing protein [Micromonospora rubida]|uniref:LysM peptidoglycan-binding domain-containing protein n=1 Tax=Micromonospora rubida TaxID=2697657 RepID=UPI0013769872|nr:LysM peptidoglycan-binding domain-containing protein [Micromonospora rubida]NBE82556.1 LysM peptidoglycan-binding domain-containing protein [Micromonospora rubida]